MTEEKKERGFGYVALAAVAIWGVFLAMAAWAAILVHGVYYAATTDWDGEILVRQGVLVGVGIGMFAWAFLIAYAYEIEEEG